MMHMLTKEQIFEPKSLRNDIRKVKVVLDFFEDEKRNVPRKAHRNIRLLYQQLEENQLHNRIGRFFTRFKEEPWTDVIGLTNRIEPEKKKFKGFKSLQWLRKKPNEDSNA